MHNITDPVGGCLLDKAHPGAGGRGTTPPLGVAFGRPKGDSLPTTRAHVDRDIILKTPAADHRRPPKTLHIM